MTISATNVLVAVFERRPYWGPELQRQFQGDVVPIRECRTVSDLLPAVVGCEASVIVLDLESSLTDCLTWLGEQASQRPAGCFLIACGSVQTAELEWLLREAGVAEFLPDVIAGIDFARLCRRHLFPPKRSFPRVE